MRSPARALRLTITRSLVLAFWVLCAWIPGAGAQQGDGVIRVELNKLESVESACRAYLLFENRTPDAYESLKLDLVMFDPEGIISRRLAVEGGPLPAGKTSVKLFDIQGVSCDSVDRVLLNGVLTCVGGDDTGAHQDDCLALIEPASRSGADFFK